MKTVEKVCKELKALDGVIGAFVLRQSRCIGSSLPTQYDFGRLGQVADVLSRVSQMSQKAGYERSSMAFHWQRASLMSWPVGDDAVLGLFALPTAVRESVNMSAALAVEDLTSIVRSGFEDDSPKPLPLLKVSAPPGPGKAGPDSAALEERLHEIEQLLVEELGTAGKSLLERCRNKTPRGKASAQDWLLALRSVVLNDVPDPGARATIATSYYWAGLD
jgi:hypothetical protein